MQKANGEPRNVRLEQLLPAGIAKTLAASDEVV
mgnify:CR=1 FL=1